MTTIRHDKPIGVDTFYREIFAGDTVRDQDGKEYTIDERGYAKSLDGVTVTGFKSLKDPVFVNSAPPIQDGPKVKPATAPAPAPAPRRREPVATGGRKNMSGFSQLCNIAGRHGISTAAARRVLEENGIPVTTRGTGKKAVFPVEYLDKARELLKDLDPVENAPRRSNNGNHRPNGTGFVSFQNLARSLKVPAYKLRDIAEQQGIEIVSSGNDKNRNDGIRKEDEDRFRECFAEQPVLKAQGYDEQLVIPLTDEDVIKEVALRGLWDRIIEHYPGFIEAISAPCKFEDASDQYLADELRRRGYELTATKTIEI